MTLFQQVNVPAVQAKLQTGAGPLRFYMFGLAPKGVEYPYAVWQLVSGQPENYLACAPNAQADLVQIDVYASESQGPAIARGAAQALITALQGHGYIVSIRGEGRDFDSMDWRSGFDFRSWTV